VIMVLRPQNWNSGGSKLGGREREPSQCRRHQAKENNYVIGNNMNGLRQESMNTWSGYFVTFARCDQARSSPGHSLSDQALGTHRRSNTA
jgi:hypothetical protein